MSNITPHKTLDLRTTKCPLNFVQAKLMLEKLNVGEVLEIWILAESESTLNIPKSMQQEGHAIIRTETDDAGTQRLWIQKRI